MTSLILRGVELRYGKSQNPILRNIDLDILPGHIVALLGPNGSGKTTLLRAASGALPPTRGTILVSTSSEPLHRIPIPARARILSVVPQTYVFEPGFTIYDAVMLGRITFHGWFGPETEEDSQAVMHALASVSLEEKRHTHLGHLSGGERQRVMIARALAQETSILLLDEPISHLDIHFQVEIMELLKRLCSINNLSICISLHDMNIASRYCDKLVFLNGGSIFASGAPQEVFTKEILKALFPVPLEIFRSAKSNLPVMYLDDGG